jgi:iron(III) transport system ATP-binding protein
MARGVTIDHVTFGYGATPVLEDISLEVARGQFFAFLGRRAPARPRCCA